MKNKMAFELILAIVLGNWTSGSAVRGQDNDLARVEIVAYDT
jgi:hypothetical protein